MCPEDHEVFFGESSDFDSYGLKGILKQELIVLRAFLSLCCCEK